MPVLGTPLIPLPIGTAGGLWGGEDCDAGEHCDPTGKWV